MIEFCSPTLAGIKCANLFGMSYVNQTDLWSEIDRVNKLCNKKGLQIKVLQIQKDRALVYVYRVKMLRDILRKDFIWELLTKFGYERGDIGEVLEMLKRRIETSEEFPHEIGIFLGYPYGDVKGFIENTGKDFLLCGHWKVYENEKQSRKMFHTFDTCKECYQNSYKNGMSIMQLTVAV